MCLTHVTSSEAMMTRPTNLSEIAGLTRNKGSILVHVNKAIVVLMTLLLAITGVLAYGVSAGYGYCGPVIASFWAVTLLVVLPIIWSWSRTSREVRACIEKQCHCNHEFMQEEHQEVMAWHGDCPIWLTVEVSWCWKCAYSEARDFQ